MRRFLVVLLVLVAVVSGCRKHHHSGGGGGSDVDIKNRVYIVNALSSTMTVIDLRDPENAEVLGVLPVASTPHMPEVSADFKKVYSSGTFGDAVTIYDAESLTKIKDLPVPAEPTHMSASPDNKYIAVCCEGTNEIAFIGVDSDTVEKIIPGMLTPHWVAFRNDMKFAYVANINGYRITILDLTTFTVSAHIFLAGHTDPLEATPVEEQGFAECFIDETGTLYSSHGEGEVCMRINTTTNMKIDEIPVGVDPWVAYVSPFGNSRVLVANQGSGDVTIINKGTGAPVATIGSGGQPVVNPNTGVTVRTTVTEDQVYGINFGNLGQKAYAGFRLNGAIQKINLITDTAETVYSLTEGLPAPGFTQPMATTADQRYLVICVTSQPDFEDPGASGPVNRIVIWDTLTDKPVKIFDGLGTFPWSATIPAGMNYCH